MDSPLIICWKPIWFWPTAAFVTVNETQHPDLFWAIRGGGGNFGIVVSFKFQAHPVKTVFGGPTFWPIEKTNEIMEWYHSFIHKAPEDLNGFIATLVVPGPPFPEALHKKQFCGIVWCYTGDLDKADEIFKPILAMNPVFAHGWPHALSGHSKNVRRHAASGFAMVLESRLF